MSFTRTTFIAAIAAVVALASNVSFAGTTFRGVSIPSAPAISSNAFDHTKPFRVDISDDFNRTGPLAGSQADGTQHGFVPPVDTRPLNGGSTLTGPLTGSLADQHGTWMSGGHGSYETNNGRVSRTSATEKGVNCLNWRVTPDLGRFYMLDMSADVADGETVSLGYFGDIDTVGAADGLAGDLGLLVLNLFRDGTNIDWEVKWEGDLPGSISGTAGNFAIGQDINMQLGWSDEANQGGPDLFDAFLNDTRLAAGNFGSAPSLGLNGNVDVFGVGFELSGTASSVDSFAAAVPEPTSGLMGLMAFFGLLTLRRRNG